jgi:hypothetical protein
VVCPRCLYTGEPGEFLSGCPGCGYLSSSSPGRKWPGEKQKGKGTGFYLSKKKKRKIELPLWVYKIVGIVVFLVLLFIITWYVLQM